MDELARQNRDITTEVADQPKLLAGQKRPRRWQRQPSQVAYSSSEDSGKGSDWENSGSDNAEGLHYQQQSGRHSKKRLTLSAIPSSSQYHRPSVKGKKEPRRKLEAQMDWGDYWWKTQKIPVDLKASIKCCDQTKVTRSHTDPCPVLSLLSNFGVRWDRILKCIYCINHSRLIPGDDFRYHFGRTSHDSMAIPGTTKYIFLTASVFHLIECYPDIQNQNHDKLKRSLPTLLQEPIALKEDSLGTPQMRYKCPHIMCEIWVAMNKGKGAPETELRRHVKTHKKILEQDFPCVLPQWTQLVGVGRGIGKGYNERGSNHYFTFPDTFQPSVENVNQPIPFTVNLAAPSTDTWAASLGWEAYVDEITPRFGSRQKAMEKLHDLVTLPSPHHVSVSVGPVKILEHGLLVSNKLNLLYLEDAAIWVSLAPRSFRAHFAHGVCV